MIDNYIGLLFFSHMHKKLKSPLGRIRNSTKKNKDYLEFVLVKPHVIV